jgi:hypothetical protein
MTITRSPVQTMAIVVLAVNVYRGGTREELRIAIALHCFPTINTVRASVALVTQPTIANHASALAADSLGHQNFVKAALASGQSLVNASPRRLRHFRIGHFSGTSLAWHPR